jgi:SAM-dependent methyltransferase
LEYIGRVFVKDLLKAVLKSFIRLSMKGMSRGATVDRYYMYERIKEAIAGFELKENPKILSISYSTYLASLLTRDGEGEVTEANYPDFDILELDLEDNSFDFVVADQVLEHIGGDPWQAMNETYRVLKPGGIAIHTTCLLNEIHDPAGDFWRFTPDGLRLLCDKFSQVVQCEGWGNKLAFFAFRYFEVPESSWHPIYKVAMKKDPEALISTWVIAQK